MRRKSFVYIGLAWAIAVAAPDAARAYCMGWDKTLPNYDANYYSVAHEFQRAKYVVKAKVIREIWVGEDGQVKPLQPPFQNGGPRPWGFDPCGRLLSAAGGDRIQGQAAIPAIDIQ